MRTLPGAENVQPPTVQMVILAEQQWRAWSKQEEVVGRNSVEVESSKLGAPARIFPFACSSSA
jgi:hypothetical protein